jgi:hypothetical protein
VLMLLGQGLKTNASFKCQSPFCQLSKCLLPNCRQQNVDATY